MSSRIVLTDLHPVLSEISKFLTFQENKDLQCAWGRLSIQEPPNYSDREIWSYCLRTSYEIEKKIIRNFLKEFILKKFSRHIDKGSCCVYDCNKDRTILINISALFNVENIRIRRIYNSLYCSTHFKENRHYI